MVEDNDWVHKAHEWEELVRRLLDRVDLDTRNSNQVLVPKVQ